MKARILLIDNDKQLNKINEKVLLASGLVSELHIASNGRTGLEYLIGRVERHYQMPDLIILELNLPIMTGFEFMHELNSMEFTGKNKIELVVFTSSSNPMDKQRAISLGVRHYLNKPYLLRGLSAVLETMKQTRVSWY